MVETSIRSELAATTRTGSAFGRQAMASQAASSFRCTAGAAEMKVGATRSSQPGTRAASKPGAQTTEPPLARTGSEQRMTLWRWAIGMKHRERSLSESPNQILELSIEAHRLACVMATILGTAVVPDVRL